MNRTTSRRLAKLGRHRRAALIDAGRTYVAAIRSAPSDAHRAELVARIPAPVGPCSDAVHVLYARMTTDELHLVASLRALPGDFGPAIRADVVRLLSRFLHPSSRHAT